MNASDTFQLSFNQGVRDCACIARTDTLALCVYTMPAGRQFLFEIPANVTLPARGDSWEALRAQVGDERYVPRTVAVKSARACWRDAIAKLAPVQQTCHMPAKYRNRPGCRCRACCANRGELA